MTNDKELYKTMEVLHWFQKYRRGGISYDELQKHCTNEDIGKAIDFAIRELRAGKHIATGKRRALLELEF